MSSKSPSAIFREAAQDLADEFMQRQFRDSITDRDAAEHVSASVAMSWIALQISDQSAQSVLADLVHKLTDAEATNLLAALLMQDGIPPLANLSAAMHDAVAHDLAYEAEKRLENYEPADDYGDRRYEQRRQDRVDARIG